MRPAGDLKMLFSACLRISQSAYTPIVTQSRALFENEVDPIVWAAPQAALIGGGAFYPRESKHFLLTFSWCSILIRSLWF